MFNTCNFSFWFCTGKKKKGKKKEEDEDLDALFEEFGVTATVGKKKKKKK